jgi:hypothetical protein
MTYDPNDPRRIEPYEARTVQERSYSPTMMGAAIVLAIIIGIAFFALRDANRTASTTSPTTTGQGQPSPRINAPAFERSVPDGTPGGQGAPAPQAK